MGSAVPGGHAPSARPCISRRLEAVYADSPSAVGRSPTRARPRAAGISDLQDLRLHSLMPPGAHPPDGCGEEAAGFPSSRD